MGVYFDFFRAADDESAGGTHELPGGPLADPTGENPPFDGFGTKGVFPTPHLEQLVALAAGVPYDPGLRTSDHVWPPAETPAPTDDSSPWLTDPSVERLSTRLRDALAAIEVVHARELARSWSPELGPGYSPEAATRVIVGLSELARRARHADQQLYCWSTL